MPTYVCSLPEGSVSTEQKQAIARAISHIHSEETDAPVYFVQVVIEEKAATRRFIGGLPAVDLIWIRGDIRGGRTELQKRRLMLRLVQEVAEITGAAMYQVWVYLCNLEPTDMVEYGHVLPGLGEEAAWYERLPDVVKDHLQRFGNAPGTFTL